MPNRKIAKIHEFLQQRQQEFITNIENETQMLKSSLNEKTSQSPKITSSQSVLLMIIMNNKKELFLFNL